MGDAIPDTIETLLASIQEDVDDKELSYKLRTARQLNLIIKERTEDARATLDEAELDEGTVERLQQLGYLDASE